MLIFLKKEKDMKKQRIISLFSMALAMPFIAHAVGNGGLEEGWTEIPGKESIEAGWVVPGKPTVSDIAYQKLGITKKASAFEILGVTVTMPKDQVRKHYMALLQKWHPDKHGNASYATEISQLLTWAYNEVK